MIVQGFKKVIFKRNGGKVVIPAGMMIEQQWRGLRNSSVR